LNLVVAGDKTTVRWIWELKRSVFLQANAPQNPSGRARLGSYRLRAALTDAGSVASPTVKKSVNRKLLTVQPPTLGAGLVPF
jgi:hypothetical protein